MTTNRLVFRAEAGLRRRNRSWGEAPEGPQR
jgi:hypothetical protein